jgi:thiol-disulfide isomerase/thioredoxin
MKLVYFHAPSCPVCHEKAPVVETIALRAGLELERWDVEEPAGSAEAARRRVTGVPTLALIDGERVPFRLRGTMITPETAEHLLSRFRPSQS